MHTFLRPELINKEGRETYCKFHWSPKCGECCGEAVFGGRTAWEQCWGLGPHTFKLINKEGHETYCTLHWQPKCTQAGWVG